MKFTKFVQTTFFQTLDVQRRFQLHFRWTGFSMPLGFTERGSSAHYNQLWGIEAISFRIYGKEGSSDQTVILVLCTGTFEWQDRYVSSSLAKDELSPVLSSIVPYAQREGAPLRLTPSDWAGRWYSLVPRENRTGAIYAPLGCWVNGHITVAPTHFLTICLTIQEKDVRGNEQQSLYTVTL